MLCTVETFRFLGNKIRDAVIGTNNFPAYPQNKNSCAHAVRNQPVAAPLFASNLSATHITPCSWNVSYSYHMQANNTQYSYHTQAYNTQYSYCRLANKTQYSYNRLPSNIQYSYRRPANDTQHMLL